MTNAAERELAANTIRTLAIDMINKANSGHPGAPLGMADIATVLWADILRFDPEHPDWPDRDRFVLSNGHASSLIYAMLHLTGYDLPMDQLQSFRQLGSKTPGHPEYGLTPGVETTTGPLGQGFATAVGMAMATRMAKARFNGKGGFDPISHRVYGLLGDGCVMEGVASEAASIAGHLKLGELIFLYDDNRITIDGSTDLSFTEDVEKRFVAYGWHTLRVDGHDQTAIRQAILESQQEDRPSLILAKTHIGFGSPNRQDTSKVHGEPLGEEEGRLTKEKLGWSEAPWTVPDSVRSLFGRAAERGKAEREAWASKVATWQKDHPEQSAAWTAHVGERKAADYRQVIEAVGTKRNATRGLSGLALNAIAQQMPGLVGGSADLAGSNKSLIKDSPNIVSDFAGRNIHFGVREHAMGSITNGIALHGGFVPFGATFLVFSDYMRPALRLSAMMKIRALQIFTHDSIGLGEDGPTHQPVEHLWALRMIPGLTVWRPGDGLETAMAWSYATGQGDPSPHAMVFTRQKLDPIARPAGFDPETIWRGGYVLSAPKGAALTIVATGSEVEIATEAAAQLERRSILARVVSMPSVERFLAQKEDYQNEVLEAGLPCVSIEAGITTPWRAITGNKGLNLGVDTFGESAPYDELYQHFQLSAKAVVNQISTFLSMK